MRALPRPIGEYLSAFDVKITIGDKKEVYLYYPCYSRVNRGI